MKISTVMLYLWRPMGHDMAKAFATGASYLSTTDKLQYYHSRLAWLSVACVKSATADASSATLTFGPAPWSGFVTNATMGLTRGGVSFAAALEYRTPTTARNAPSKKKTEMAVQRLSTWDHRKQICSMKGKSMGSRKGSITNYYHCTIDNSRLEKYT